MADSDVTITAGAGTKIDTRTVGPGVDEHRQVIVVGDPTTNTAVAPVTAASGLRVEPYMTNTGGTGIAGFQQEDQPHVDGHAGVMMLGVRNHFSGSTTDGDYAAVSVSSYGDLHTIARRDLQRIAVTAANLSTATGGGAPATTYTAGDQTGNLFTLANAARITGGSGVITGVTLICASTNIGAFDVVFFDSSVTLATDNSAFSISDADALKIVGLVQLAGAYTFALNQMTQAVNIAMPYVCSGGTSLYAALITRRANAVYGATTDIQLNVYVERY